MAQADVDADVAIVGFGPVGAALAGLLGKRSIKVIAIDASHDVFPLPRAAHIDHQGLQLLQELGCLDELMPRMIINRGLDFINGSGELLLRIPGDQPSISGLPSSMYFHQPSFDRTLRKRVAELPSVSVRLGVEMTDVEVHSDHAVVHAREASGEQMVIRARWVIGCDGALSSLREMADIGLSSLNFDEKWVVVDLLLKSTIDTLPDRALNVCDPARPTTAIPIPDGRFRFEVMVLPGEDEEDLQRPERVLPLLAKWVPPEAVELERSAVYTFHGLIAEPWRVGRALIAGDAAHQMPPFLGQGMNSGLRDAGNLAWKLAMVVQGQAKESLLDTYGLERSPHVRAIIEAAIKYGGLTCILDPKEAAERDKRFRADPRPPNRRMPFGLPVLRSGPLVREGGGELFPQPQVRGSANRLDDFVGSRFLVLGRSNDALAAGAEWWAKSVGALVRRIDEMPQAAEEIERWMERRSADVVVVRPDRYVMAADRDLRALTRDVEPFFNGRPFHSRSSASAAMSSRGIGGASPDSASKERAPKVRKLS